MKNKPVAQRRLENAAETYNMMLQCLTMLLPLARQALGGLDREGQIKGDAACDAAERVIQRASIK